VQNGGTFAYVIHALSMRCRLPTFQSVQLPQPDPLSGGRQQPDGEPSSSRQVDRNLTDPFGSLGAIYTGDMVQGRLSCAIWFWPWSRPVA
jgi:hypothetical protein